MSSLFKKNKNFLGIYKFKLLSKLTKKNIVILGGVSKNNIKKRHISFENHYFWKSNNLRNCSELVVSLVFELLKILIFIEDTGLFQMYNIHYETTLVLLENQYFEWLKKLSKMFLLVNVLFSPILGGGQDENLLKNVITLTWSYVGQGHVTVICDVCKCCLESIYW